MAKSPNRLMSALVCAVLIIGLTVPAQAAETPFADAIRVGSYKGNALNIGEISGLIISSGTASCTAVSDAPAVVSVANVLGHWTATAQGPGTATITVTASDGRTGRINITVASAIPADENGRDSAIPTANTEVRQELVRLINQARRDNGVAELPVNDVLMDAAQVCSDRLYT